MKRLRMLEAWNKFSAAVVPEAASDAQKQETRRAFYAGAWAYYTTIMGAFTPGADPSPADLEMMADLDEELRAFAEDVKAGKK